MDAATPRDAEALPRERLARLGATGLSDRELIEILVSPGSRDVPGEFLARTILASCGPVRRLSSRRVGELAALPGVGPAKACRLVAAFELGRRAVPTGDDDTPLGTAAAVRARFERLANETDEAFVAVAVNSRNRVTGEWVVARGWESGVNISTRQVFTLLVKEGVSRVVLVHNHPSGDPTPSPEDVRFTGRLLDAARLLDIRVLDHVVVARGGYASLRETRADDLEFG